MNDSKEYSLQVFAAHKWQKTNVIIRKKNNYIVHVRSEGKWYLNPNWGPVYRYVDGNGHPKFVAGSGFMLPGVHEGALIGRVGGKIFFLGENGYVPKECEGELELCCNDSNSGHGFKDNKGFLTVTISKTNMNLKTL